MMASSKAINKERSKHVKDNSIVICSGVKFLLVVDVQSRHGSPLHSYENAYIVERKAYHCNGSVVICMCIVVVLGDRIMKILFTGAQGTGKSTLVNAMKGWDEFKDYDFIDSISREYQREVGVDLKGGKATSEEVQRDLFYMYRDVFDVNSNVISARSLIDVLAYTKYRVDEGKIPEMLWEEQKDMLWCWDQDNWDDVYYIYTPIEFIIEDDGIRNTDKDMQREIDANIRWWLQRTEIRTITVTGSVEERLKTIRDKLKL